MMFTSSHKLCVLCRLKKPKVLSSALQSDIGALCEYKSQFFTIEKYIQFQKYKWHKIKMKWRHFPFSFFFCCKRKSVVYPQQNISFLLPHKWKSQFNVNDNVWIVYGIQHDNAYYIIFLVHITHIQMNVRIPSHCSLLLIFATFFRVVIQNCLVYFISKLWLWREKC